MARSPLLLGGLLGLLLAGGLGVTTLDRPQDQGRLYTVAQVEDVLARRPAAWVGRTVLVRGIAEACPPASISNAGGLPPYLASCRIWPPDLADPGAASTSGPLHVAWGAQRPLLAVLRRVPLLSGLVPPAQSLQWGSLATYRVQLQAVRCGPNGQFCDQALLLDALP